MKIRDEKEKICIKCLQTKPIGEFVTNTNLCNKCKSIYNHFRYLKTRLKRRDYDRDYARIYYKNHKEKINTRTRKYNSQMRKTNYGRLKYNAYQKLQYHLKLGDIKRQPCEKCGKSPTQAHHYNGYENALDVRWLCPRCHKEEHYVA